MTDSANDKDGGTMDSSETNVGVIDYVLHNREDEDECKLTKLPDHAGAVYNWRLHWLQSCQELGAHFIAAKIAVDHNTQWR